MRCFLAIELPCSALRAFERAGRAIRELDAGWEGEKWAATDVMHVTLRFLGEIDAGQIEQIDAGFSAAASRIPAFSLAVQGLRAVPNSRRASMIWSRIEDPTGACARLAEEAELVAQACGLTAESRRFVPHVTLVRARRARPVRPGVLDEATRRSGLNDVGPLSVPSASLFASTLTPHGPIHQRLREFVLNAGEGR